jgi:8-oxo-dGTP pyrophosphatase MutT (NUDIX family)
MDNVLKLLPAELLQRTLLRKREGSEVFPLQMLVYDKERLFLNSYGLPGGMIDDGEDPHTAMRKEWNEEVGSPIEDCIFIHEEQRKGEKGFFSHYFFLIKIPENYKLRKEGVLGETGPPEWLKLQKIGSRETKLHYSHLKGLGAVIKKLAKTDRNMAFVVSEAGI